MSESNQRLLRVSSASHQLWSDRWRL